jgi:hypothetical protein
MYFIKKEALFSCMVDKIEVTFEDIMQSSRKKQDKEQLVLNYIDTLIICNNSSGLSII